MYDEYDQPSFCLINRATNEALCGTPEEGQMVRTTTYIIIQMSSSKLAIC